MDLFTGWFEWFFLYGFIYWKYRLPRKNVENRGTHFLNLPCAFLNHDLDHDKFQNILMYNSAAQICFTYIAYFWTRNLLMINYGIIPESLIAPLIAIMSNCAASLSFIHRPAQTRNNSWGTEGSLLCWSTAPKLQSRLSMHLPKVSIS